MFMGMLVSFGIIEWRAACLCCVGWCELFSIRLTVVVGFLYIFKLCLLSSFVMVMSKKLWLCFVRCQE